MPTASVQNVRLIIAAAAVRGVAPALLITELGLAPQQLLDPDARVPAELAVRAWKLAALRCGDPAFGLATVEHLRPDSLGGLGWAMHASATVREGLERLARFLRLSNQYAWLKLLEEGARVRVRFGTDYDIDPEELRHPTECLLWGILVLLGRTTGTVIGALGVSFRHAAPADLGRMGASGWRRCSAARRRSWCSIGARWSGRIWRRIRS